MTQQTKPHERFLPDMNYKIVTMLIDVKGELEFSLSANLVVKSIAVNSSAMDLLIVGDQLIRINQEFVWSVDEADSFFGVNGKYEIQVLRQAYKTPLKDWRGRQCNIKRNSRTNCFVAVFKVPSDVTLSLSLIALPRKGTFLVSDIDWNTYPAYILQINDVLMDVESRTFRTLNEFRREITLKATSGLQFTVAVTRPDDAKMPSLVCEESYQDRNMNWPLPSDVYLIGQREVLRFKQCLLTKDSKSNPTETESEVVDNDEDEEKQNWIENLSMRVKRSRVSPRNWSGFLTGGRSPSNPTNKDISSPRRRNLKQRKKRRRASVLKQRGSGTPLSSLRNRWKKRTKKEGRAVINTNENEEEQVKSDVTEDQKLSSVDAETEPSLRTRMIDGALNWLKKSKDDATTMFPTKFIRRGFSNLASPGNQPPSPRATSSVKDQQGRGGETQLARGGENQLARGGDNQQGRAGEAQHGRAGETQQGRAADNQPKAAETPKAVDNQDDPPARSADRSIRRKRSSDISERRKRSKDDSVRKKRVKNQLAEFKKYKDKLEDSRKKDKKGDKKMAEVVAGDKKMTEPVVGDKRMAEPVAGDRKLAEPVVGDRRILEPVPGDKRMADQVGDQKLTADPLKPNDQLDESKRPSDPSAKRTKRRPSPVETKRLVDPLGTSMKVKDPMAGSRKSPSESSKNRDSLKDAKKVKDSVRERKKLIVPELKKPMESTRERKKPTEPGGEAKRPVESVRERRKLKDVERRRGLKPTGEAKQYIEAAGEPKGPLAPAGEPKGPVAPPAETKGPEPAGDPLKNVEPPVQRKNLMEPLAEPTKPFESTPEPKNANNNQLEPTQPMDPDQETNKNPAETPPAELKKPNVPNDQ
ncbi:unnamed protein product [Bursaphelenchus okinawaensis]|uniref:PDZ domain-containing protein n=1 Tax=Bursaphelenchus okinawaensis TaxID=465554 RepID=A0A811JZX2_9BILA|nr:unnamed protein product [Bursaphelenchus okinawaensis]CAG9088644.1 unnamed protein product [Bursaphelenchus okinawaensis]